MRIQTTITVSVIGDNGREMHRSVHKTRSSQFDQEGEQDKAIRNYNVALGLAKKHALATTQAFFHSLLS